MRRGCCCQGGSQQEGNSECVPLCAGTHVYNFTFAMSHAGWSRGTPGVESEFEQPPDCAPDCCGGRYMQVERRDSTVGKYTGKYHADGLWNPSDLCQCCKIESSEIETPAGNWSADFQYTYATNAWVVNNYVHSYNYANGLVAAFFACADHPYTYTGNCVCPGAGGLFDQIRITASGQNLVDFDANDLMLTDCGLNSTSQWLTSHTAILYYLKPVPFAACRTLAGTYRLACARYTVPRTPWLALALDRSMYGTRKFTKAPPAACSVETLLDYFDNDPIYSCGPDAGFTVPRTIVVA